MCSSLFEVRTTGHVRRVSHFAGLHAYVVSNAGARFLLEHIPQVAYHIDVQTALTSGLRVYALAEDSALQDGEESSQNASLGFPKSLTTILQSIPVSNNVSLAYFANVTMFRLGPYSHHLLVTPLLLVFLALGLYGVPWYVIVPYAALDTLLFPPVSWNDPLTKLAVYALGLIYRLIHLSL
jgi:hypothetical protein